MTQQAKSFTIAISLTVADIVIAIYPGGIIWRALSVILAARILLILLGGLWAISLLHLWVRAFHIRRRTLRAQDAGLWPRVAVPAAKLSERRHV